jgi:hypothetical protein
VGDAERDATEDLNDLGRRLTAATVNLRDAVKKALDGVNWADLRDGIVEAVEQVRAERAAWEAEHPGVPYGSPCGCLCGAVPHQGICTGDAVTAAPRVSPSLGPYTLLLCEPCSSALAERDELRAIAARVGAEEADG